MFDLHVHTNFSDGLHSPDEVVRMAKHAGLKGIAITDHNSLEGLPLAKEEGRKLGIEIIPGIEITSCQEEFIGLFIDPENPALLQMLREIDKNYHELFQAIYEYLNKNFSMNINSEIIENSSVKKGRKNVTFLCIAEYIRDVSGLHDVEEVFDSIFKTRECFSIYDKYFRRFPYARKVIEIIHQAGGISILCHPAYNKRFVYHDFSINSYQLMKRKLIRETLNEMEYWGLNGIETNYPVIDSPDSSLRSEMKEIINECVKNFQLLPSGGSDFHGLAVLPLNRLGEYYLDEIEMDRLRRVISDEKA